MKLKQVSWDTHHMEAVLHLGDARKGTLLIIKDRQHDQGPSSASMKSISGSMKPVRHSAHGCGLSGLRFVIPDTKQ